MAQPEAASSDTPSAEPRRIRAEKFELLHNELVRAHAVTPEDALDMSAQYGLSPEHGRIRTMALLGDAAMPRSILEMHRKYVGTHDGVPLADVFHLQLRLVDEYDEEGRQLAGLFWREELHGRDEAGNVIPDRRSGSIDFLPLEPPLHDVMMGSLVRTVMAATGLRVPQQSELQGQE